MKTLLLFITSMLLSITTVSAGEITKHYRYAQPVVFVERGVEFLVFPDGSFDFNTNHNNAYYNNTNNRRSSINASYHGPRVSINYSSNTPARTYISRDRNGMIRSIGYVNLNYDRFGKITRIGSVFIDYGRGRNGTLTQVGGLRVHYNHWGEIVNTRGYVNQNNRLNRYITPRDAWAYNDNRHYDNDNNYYYYKQNGKIKKQRKRK